MGCRVEGSRVEGGAGKVESREGGGVHGKRQGSRVGVAGNRHGMQAQ